jgi:hypothetical protein
MESKLRCERCKRDLPLVFHHVYEVQYGGKGYDFQLLCEECHNRLHKGKPLPEHTAIIECSPAERGIKLITRLKKQKSYGFCEVPRDPITEELICEVARQLAEFFTLYQVEPFLWQAEIPKQFAFADGKLLIKAPEQMPLLP